MNARLLAITTILLLVISGCGQSVGSDVRSVGSDVRSVGSDVSRYNPELPDCPRCDLRGADLSYANLSYADLRGANLDDVFNPNYRGASNVSPEYLKD